MSVTGLCMICEQREAEHQCPRCGRLVCDVHFDEDTGLDTQCSADVGDVEGPWDGEPIDPEDHPDLGGGIHR